MTDHRGRQYVIREILLDRAVSTAVCRSFLRAIRPRVGRVVIDAYSDARKQLTPEAVEAQARLRSLGRNRSDNADPGMGIALSAQDSDEWELAYTYAPWSINADFFDQVTGEEAANLHDSGSLIEARLLPGEVHDLTQDIRTLPITLESIESFREFEATGRKQPVIRPA